MSAPLTLAAQWATYRTVVLADAGPIQISETRKAFYSGEVAMLQLLDKAAGAGSHTAELEALEKLNLELDAFSREVAKAAVS